VEARKKLPKRKKRVVTPLGEGVVVDVYPLKESVQVELESGGQREFPHDQIQPWEELEALRKRAEAPCAIHGRSDCNCAKDKKKPSRRKRKRKSR
jgi:hypothetical protein